MKHFFYFIGVAKVYGACPVVKVYGVKCDLPCGV